MSASDLKCYNGSFGSATPGTVACEVLNAAGAATIAGGIQTTSILASGAVSAATFTGPLTRSGQDTILAGNQTVAVLNAAIAADSVVLAQYLVPNGGAADGTLTAISHVELQPGVGFTIHGNGIATADVLVGWAWVK